MCFGLCAMQVTCNCPMKFSGMFWEGFSEEVHLLLLSSIRTHTVTMRREEPWRFSGFRERAANLAGIHSYPEEVSPQSFSVNYHTNVQVYFMKQCIYHCNFQ